ncbi:MAG: type VI secretion protein [Sphingomonadales bacterium]|nr:type VI secretion protein [Sphingomonadales bacterium]
MRYLVIGHVALGLLYWLSTFYVFVVNRSDSLPDYLYYSSYDMPVEKGGYVAFYPKKTPLVRAHFGGESIIFVKHVFGVAGDVVTHSPQGDVLVNGDFVGKIKRSSMRGELLDEGPVGIIPKGCIYAGSLHKNGFDTRYAAIGYICSAQIYGGARPLL